MLSVYRTLSVRYLRQRWTRALLIVASIALGVATLVATQALSTTMDKAVRVAANPLAGGADLQVSGGTSGIDINLRTELAKIRGVQAVRPLLLQKVKLLDLETDRDRTVLLVGIELLSAVAENPWGVEPIIWDPLGAGRDRVMRQQKQCVVGEELNAELDEKMPNRSTPLRIQAHQQKLFRLTRVGTINAHGPAAALGGNLLATDIDTAALALGQSRQAVELEKKIRVTRLDLILEEGADPKKVSRDVSARLDRLKVDAKVTTPEEEVRSSQKAMAGMQAAFSLCGIGALVVGMFLVYNALSVSVAERRHEIGILRSLGATRMQVRGLFAGEAAILGLAGAALGVPLGLGLAYLGLEPVRDALRDTFRAIEANRVEWTVRTVTLAVGAGVVTALLASLVPAFQASAEEPAVAVRRIPPNPTWRFRMVQLAASVLLALAGVACILARKELPERLGIYGGLGLVLFGALLAIPLFAAVAARAIQPLARRCFSIEGRLAADNLVRAPARTGLVIAALAAGVALVFQTAGTIRSNRESYRAWVEKYFTADLYFTAGGPISPGGKNELLEASLGEQIQDLAPKDIQAALPFRFRNLAYQDDQVVLIGLPARRYYDTDKGRASEVPNLDLYLQLSKQPGSALISENFAALYRVKVGDTIELSGKSVRVLGTVVDYWWHRGTVVMDWQDYSRVFNEDKNAGVDFFQVFLRPGADPSKTSTVILRRIKANTDLFSLRVYTKSQVQQYYAEMIERLYAIAYAQQIVVGMVAILGVVTAMLISVLQRRREMGVLRAIGATRAQIVRSIMAEAALMGMIGTAIGLLVGIPIEWYILQVVCLEVSGYLFPVTIPWLEAGIITAVALITATLAGLGPAIHAVRQRIPEAIAHE